MSVSCDMCDEAISTCRKGYILDRYTDKKLHGFFYYCNQCAKHYEKTLEQVTKGSFASKVANREAQRYLIMMQNVRSAQKRKKAGRPGRPCERSV
jgi:response regulator of citrate/malate metabolism